MRGEGSGQMFAALYSSSNAVSAAFLFGFRNKSLHAVGAVRFRANIGAFSSPQRLGPPVRDSLCKRADLVVCE